MKRYRRGLLLILLFVGLFFAAYTVYWNAKSRLMVTDFETGKMLARNQGGLLKGTPSVSGFPFSHTFTLTGFAYESPGEISVAADVVHMASPFWAPLSTRITATNTNVHLIRRDIRTGAAQINVWLGRSLIDAKTHKDSSLHIDAQLENILAGKNFAVLSENLQRLSFEADVFGPLGHEFNAKSVEEWRRAGGTIGIHDLTCDWGSLHLQGDGTLAFDARQQPLASFDARVRGYEPVFNALATNGQMKPIEASLAKAALKLLEERPQHNEPAMTRLPLTVQDDALTAAGFHLAHWEPLVW